MNKNIFYVEEDTYEFLRYLEELSKNECDSEIISSIIMLKGFLHDEDNPICEILENYGVMNSEIEFFYEDMLERDSKKELPEIEKKVEVTIINITNDNTVLLQVTDDVLNVLTYAFEIVEQYEEIESVNETVLGIAFVQKLPSECVRLLRRCDVFIKELKKEVTIQNLIMPSIIPVELKAFLSDVNLSIDISQPCEILGRDQEVNKLWDILLKKEKSNAILVGDPGVGKTAIVEKIAYDIKSEQCPNDFLGYHVISLSVNSIIAGTSYRGEAEQNFDELIKYIESNSNIILFIDEIHTILGAGACREGEMDLANALKPVLARGKCKIIGGTTTEEYNKYFSNDGALKRRFKKIFVEEPEIDEVYPMIKNKIEALKLFHGVDISRNMIDECIDMATCFDYETANPDRSLDVIDVAMAKAKRNGANNVQKEDIMNTFNMNYKSLKKMSKEDIKAIAYHEAGHFVVRVFSDHIKDEETLLISIVPAEDYLGVNAYDKKRYKQVIYSEEYLLEKIECNLGGRIGESCLTGHYSVGASSDLVKATKTAKEYIAKYGMSDSISKNFCIYFDEGDESVMSESSRIKYEAELEKIINVAYSKAENKIKSNMELLETVAEKLIKEHILKKADLEKIVSEYKKSKNLIS